MPQLLDPDLAAGLREDGAAGPAQGVIEEARRRQRARRIRTVTAATIMNTAAAARGGLTVITT